ncbi:hypothetical protein GWK47_027259 [Chionoecetes opilio]|uniref:Uncharacterized protein n=1 Tax=Chionoecetes opilio TaxID=41210 RepID=A0A8J8WE69_CHIOP|nr:hypothetical protein GWK47_027259 [Chionoecetes opilio]
MYGRHRAKEAHRKECPNCGSKQHALELLSVPGGFAGCLSPRLQQQLRHQRRQHRHHETNGHHSNNSGNTASFPAPLQPAAWSGHQTPHPLVAQGPHPGRGFSGGEESEAQLTVSVESGYHPPAAFPPHCLTGDLDEVPVHHTRRTPSGRPAQPSPVTCSARSAQRRESHRRRAPSCHR